MTSSNRFPNNYTNQIEQHSNIFIGTLRFVFWLFFHPSAWVNFVSTLNPDLRPDFYLAELTKQDLRKPIVQKFLFQSFVLLPLYLTILNRISNIPLSQIESSSVNWHEYILGIFQAIFYWAMVNITFSLFLSVGAGIVFITSIRVTSAMMLLLKALLILLFKFTFPENFTYDISYFFGIGIVSLIMAKTTLLSPDKNQSFKLLKQVQTIFFSPLYICLFMIIQVIIMLLIGYLVVSITGVSQGQMSTYSDIFASAVSGKIKFEESDFIVLIILSVICGFTYKYLFEWRREKGIFNSKKSKDSILLISCIVPMTIGIIWSLYLTYPIYVQTIGIILGIYISILIGKYYRDWKYTVISILSLVFIGYTGGLVFLQICASFRLVLFISIFYIRSERFSGAWSGALTLTLFWGGLLPFSAVQNYGDRSYLPILLLAPILGLTLNWWLPIILYPLISLWNNALYQFDLKNPTTKGSALRYHSAFWDELQYLPLFGLDKHIVLVAEYNLDEAAAAIDYLSTTRQKRAAQTAQIEIDARALQNCADIFAIGESHHKLAAGELESPVNTLLKSFSIISKNVEASLGQVSSYNQRLTLKAVIENIEGLIRELTRSSEVYASRFRPIAKDWKEVIQSHIDILAKKSELLQEIDSPYIIGLPLTEQQIIFVGRTDISNRIERLILDRPCPPLLLYGQRRTGKTSLLNNLGRLLPSNIIPMFVDLQGPVSSASNHAGFLYNLIRAMELSLRKGGLTITPLTREDLANDPFTSFDEWLDKVEHILGNKTVLLALDEFEVLDKALADGKFNEANVLGMLRNLIQHRPKFKVLFSGSHTLQEFQRWASYLINTQVIHLGYLQESEARTLVEQPTPDFALNYHLAASDRVLYLTRCHPFLVQLLCQEIVTLKNEQDPKIRRWATLADVEASIPATLDSGIMFFTDIERNQIDAQARHILKYIASQGEKAIVTTEILANQVSNDLNLTLDSLLRRELIEKLEGGYRFQVELIRRWFVR